MLLLLGKVLQSDEHLVLVKRNGYKVNEVLDARGLEILAEWTGFAGAANFQVEVEEILSWLEELLFLNLSLIFGSL